MTRDGDTYSFVVVFTRSWSDDSDVLGYESPSPEALAQQLTKELQAGYDKTMMAGHFQIVSMIDGGEVYTIDNGRKRYERGRFSSAA